MRSLVREGWRDYSFEPEVQYLGIEIRVINRNTFPRIKSNIVHSKMQLPRMKSLKSLALISLIANCFRLMRRKSSQCSGLYAFEWCGFHGLESFMSVQISYIGTIQRSQW
jgi:hypothetical protein